MIPQGRSISNTMSPTTVPEPSVVASDVPSTSPSSTSAGPSQGIHAGEAPSAAPNSMPSAAPEPFVVTLVGEAPSEAPSSMPFAAPCYLLSKSWMRQPSTQVKTYLLHGKILHAENFVALMIYSRSTHIRNKLWTEIAGCQGERPVQPRLLANTTSIYEFC